MSEAEGIPLSHESLSIRNAVDALGVKRVVESVGIKRVVEEVGIERVIEEVGPEYLFQNMLEVASEDDLKKFRQMLHMR